MAQASEIRSALFGQVRHRTFLVSGAAVVLFFVAFSSGTIAETRGWEVLIHFVVLFLLVVGGAVAAGNAYWNDGLFGSCFLVFCLAFGWLWTVFVQQGTVSFAEAFPPFAWAVFAALVVGTVGYVVGRRLRDPLPRDTGDEPTGWLLGVLVGFHTDRSGIWGPLAIGLFLVAGGLIYGTRPFFPLPVEGVSLIEVFTVVGVFVASIPVGTTVFLGWLGLAAWPAYRNEGLLVSWGLLLGPLFGAIVVDFVTSGMTGNPIIDATLAFLLALVLAVSIGTCGFVLGRGLRRTVVWVRATDDQRVSA